MAEVPRTDVRFLDLGGVEILMGLWSGVFRPPIRKRRLQAGHLVAIFGRIVEIAHLQRVLVQIKEEAPVAGAGQDQLARGGAGHDLPPASGLGEDKRMAGTFVVKILPVHLGPRPAAPGPAEGRGQIDVADHPLGDRSSPLAAGPLDHQRHLDQRVVHVVALQEHVVMAHIIAVVGRVDDQRVFVQTFLA